MYLVLRAAFLLLHECKELSLFKKRQSGILATATNGICRQLGEEDFYTAGGSFFPQYWPLCGIFVTARHCFFTYPRFVSTGIMFVVLLVSQPNFPVKFIS
ncbi:MAG TPA: hypothetical protein VF476_13275 [Chitinophagaceae bacterium]